MTSDTTTKIFRVWIRSTPEKIWAAITDPQWTVRYGYAAPVDYDLKPGGAYSSAATDDMKAYAKQGGFELPEVIVDGEVIKSEPPNLLVQTWRMLMDPTTAAEPFSKLTYEIEELTTQPGVCKLTVTHELPGSPATATMVAGTDEVEAGGGWAWVLSDLKSLLETGKSFNE
jgi:uncharacterized protein YndB with AHSA1/START domain